MISLLFWLIFGHVLADYALQTEFIGQQKNHRLPSHRRIIPWQLALFAHAMIHGGIVAWITGSIVCGIFEVIAHMIIDYGKSNDDYGIWFDQAAHVLCKILFINYLF